MKCPDCGAKVLKDLAVCPACGKEVRSRIRTIRCRSCGARVPRGVRICPQCGRAPAIRRRVRVLVASVLLGILLGVAAFAAGHNYLSEVRYRLGVMLIEGSGRAVQEVPATESPVVTPAP